MASAGILWGLLQASLSADVHGRRPGESVGAGSMTGGGGKSRFRVAGNPAGRRRPSPRHAMRIVTNQIPELIEWLNTQHDGYPTVSILFKALREPGRTGRPGHQILHEIPPARLQLVHGAFIRLPRMAQQGFYLKHGWLRHEDGSEVSDKERAEKMGISVRAWYVLISRARTLMCDEIRGVA